MPTRLRLIDVRRSDIPHHVGLCPDDPRVASVVNDATQRLLLDRAQGDTGWWGTWAEMAFNVSREQPHIVAPRTVARLIDMDVCNSPVRIENQFYEYLRFGVGKQPPRPNCATGSCQGLSAYDRGVFPTLTDLAEARRIRVYPGDLGDLGKRTLISGSDNNGQPIYSIDAVSGLQVQGVYVTLAAPFADTDIEFSVVSAIQKDITIGSVSYFSVNYATGDQSQIAILEPSEEVAGYRRYFLHRLPKNCCNTDSSSSQVQVTAMAKLDFIPVKVDSDFLLIGNLAALTEEAQAIRYDKMDVPGASAKSAEHHTNAIRYLQGELKHYEGTDQPAISYALFGSARLRRYGVGSMI